MLPVKADAWLGAALWHRRHVPLASGKLFQEKGEYGLQLPARTAPAGRDYVSHHALRRISRRVGWKPATSCPRCTLGVVVPGAGRASPKVVGPRKRGGGGGARQDGQAQAGPERAGRGGAGRPERGNEPPRSRWPGCRGLSRCGPAPGRALLRARAGPGGSCQGWGATPAARLGRQSFSASPGAGSGARPVSAALPGERGRGRGRAWRARSGCCPLGWEASPPRRRSLTSW